MPWLIHMCDMTHSYVWHDSSICVTWLIHMCDMTHPYMWHESFIRVTCSYVWRDSCANVTWIIHVCDMTHAVTHPYGWHDVFGAFSSGTALAATPFRSKFYKCEMTHPVTNLWGWNFKGAQWQHYATPSRSKPTCHVREWVMYTWVWLVTIMAHAWMRQVTK